MKPVPLSLVLILIIGVTAAAGTDLQNSNASNRIYPGPDWEFAATPEDCGWSSAKLAQAQAFSRQIGSAAVMVVDSGVVVAAWGHVSHRYPLHSIRKPLISALVGIHTAEGAIDITRSMEDLGIDDVAPGLSPTEKQATVADLMQSRSGVYHPALGEVAAMKQARPTRGSHRPGTFWYYNNWDFNAVGTIFEQETGTRIFEEFAKRIATPLQMQDFIARDGTYISGPESMHRVYAMRMSARDLARFGLLYLRQGRWRGRQIVPSSWVEESTAVRSDIGRGRGYGYMWRTAINGGLAPNIDLPVRCFFHSGAGIHFLIVIPRLDLVMVHRVDTYRKGPYPRPQQIGRLFWMILDARGLNGIGANPSLAHAQGMRLTGDRLRDVLTSHRYKVMIPNGLVQGGDQKYMLAFMKGGVMNLTSSKRDLVTGSWRLSGDRCCVDIDGLKSCFAIVAAQEVLQFYDATDTLFLTADQANP
jgi:CubicO group peptidase (beta-lactamase class C family)